MKTTAQARNHQQRNLDAAGRPAQYYYCASFRNGQPRVILLVGTAWRPPMRRHYGIDGEPFFTRDAYPGEPDVYPNRHPWGWAFEPDRVLEYERDSGMTELDLAALRSSIARASSRPAAAGGAA